MTIKNIHIRFENPYAKRNYSWGLTLDEILIKTCNDKWQAEFIDRTDEKNKLLPLRKLLSMKNLGVYWNSNEKELLSILIKKDGPKINDAVNKAMSSLILKDSTKTSKIQYIINQKKPKYK